MQRIDENTYIDDTLVTCAEYQLFIDEMREQGKYYQPDHWTSYQFPEGQAREPILGVRHSDAVAFCEWLTYREANEWKYRLPTQEEAEIFPMKPSGQSLLGCWVENLQFTWLITIPADIHPLSINRNRILDRTLDRALELARAISTNIYTDMLALQERIAGRSPAFEGIRLIKERIR